MSADLWLLIIFLFFIVVAVIATPDREANKPDEQIIQEKHPERENINERDHESDRPKQD